MRTQITTSKRGAVGVILGVVLALLLVAGLGGLFAYLKIIKPEAIRKEYSDINSKYERHKKAVDEATEFLTNIEDASESEFDSLMKQGEDSVKDMKTSRTELEAAINKSKLPENKAYVQKIQGYLNTTEEFSSYIEKVVTYKKAEKAALDFVEDVFKKMYEVANYQLNLSTYYAFMSKVESTILDINTAINKMRELDPPSGYKERVKMSVDILSSHKIFMEQVLEATKQVKGSMVTQATQESNARLAQILKGADSVKEKFEEIRDSYTTKVKEKAEDVETEYSKLTKEYGKK